MDVEFKGGAGAITGAEAASLPENSSQQTYVKLTAPVFYYVVLVIVCLLSFERFYHLLPRPKREVPRWL